MGCAPEYYAHSLLYNTAGPLQICFLWAYTHASSPTSSYILQLNTEAVRKKEEVLIRGVAVSGGQK